MDFFRGWPKNLESKISICLLGVLLLITIWMVTKKTTGYTSWFAKNKSALSKTDKQQDETLDLRIFTPKNFNAVSETKIYNEENLYRKINGKAPLYTESGFRKLFTQVFINNNQPNIGFEVYVYDMATAKNAFCVYSTQKRADAKSLPDIGFAYKTTNALFLICDYFYIEMIGWAESDEMLRAMMQSAEKIKRKYPKENITKIPELSLFPSENLIPDSKKLYLVNAFGSEGMTDIFTAKYKFTGQEVTAFLSKRSSAGEADKIQKQYQKFLIDNDAREIRKEENKTILEFYGSYEIISVTGKYIFGIHEAEDLQLAEKVNQTLFENLK